MRLAPALGSAIVLVVVACGESPPATSPTSLAATAPATASAPAGTSPTPPAPACHAQLAKDRPAGWVEVGKLLITVKDEMPSAYELRDASGTKVDAGEVTLKGPRAAGDFVAQKICKIGGVLAIYEAKPAADGTLVTTVVKPAREDEAADLAALCKEPPGMGTFDDAQKRRVAVERYEQLLTTPQWRGWLFEMSAKLRKADDNSRPGIMAAEGDTLTAAARRANISACWFATTLKKP